MLLIQSVSLGIEDVKKVYLQEAITAAVENNIDLQAAKLEIDIAKIISKLRTDFKILHLKLFILLVHQAGVNPDSLV